MAPEPVNGEGNDGAREKQSYKVYTRKPRGSKKQPSTTALAATAATSHREKQEGNVTLASKPAQAIERKEDETQNNDDNSISVKAPPEKKDVNSDVVDTNSVEAPPETLSREDVGSAVVSKNSMEAPAPPETLTQEDADTVVVDKNMEGPSQTLVQEDVNSALVGENSVEAPSETLAKEDANIVVVGKKSMESPSQTLALEDFNAFVIDNNSVKAPPEILAEEDVNTVVVDKNTIEASHRAVAQEDTDTVVVDKNPIGMPPQESDDALTVNNNLTQTLTQHDSLPAAVPNAREYVSGTIAMDGGSDDRIRINLASSSRQQKKELRKRLEGQLDLVRGLVRRIEVKEGEISGYGNSRVLVNAGANNGGSRMVSGLTSPVAPREVIRLSRPLHQLNISVFENNQGVNEHVEKEKRTPKANQFYRNSEFLLAKDKFPPAESNKKSKLSAKKQGAEHVHGFVPGSKIFKNCSALLERLMKHKHGWVFNAPVDAKGLGLHDYFIIIKYPMDLGTIKSRLTKNWYRSPREFAEDVRLTFHNAMTYNPKGQDVHIMAEQLSDIFEDRWTVIEADYNREMRFATDYEMNLPTPRSRQASIVPLPFINVRNMVERSDWNIQPKPTSTTPSGRTPSLKKPKANEPNKRDMTYEEKQKLSVNLQNLPSEKLDQIVHIVKKRNSAVDQRDDEIEVDIDSVDPETLWELDRFITNYKKSLSKKKRKAELAIQARAEAEKNVQQKTTAPVTEELANEGNTAVKKLSTPIPSQAKKQNDNASRSSSSGSSTSDSSSSSSDSDSDSSSSSGSDQT